jgi:hypothetical protein
MLVKTALSDGVLACSAAVWRGQVIVMRGAEVDVRAATAGEMFG